MKNSINKTLNYKQMKTRKVISLTFGISFLIVSITGIVLFFIPRGRNAYLSGWKIAGLTRQQWAGIHIMVAILLLVIGIWHIALNWRAIICYMKNSIHKVSLLNPNFLLALFLNIVIVAGTFFMLPPFSSVLYLKHNVEHPYNIHNMNRGMGKHIHWKDYQHHRRQSKRDSYKIR